MRPHRGILGPTFVFVVYLYLCVCWAYLQPFVNCKSLRELKMGLSTTRRDCEGGLDIRREMMLGR